MRRLGTIAWLVVVWVTLWEAVTWANVLGGIAVALAVIALLPPESPPDRAGFRPGQGARLLLYFAWELLAASAFMAWEVVTPRNRIGAAVVSVPLTSRRPGVLTAVANLVSLTPGTVTLDVDETKPEIYVHVLHLESFEATRASVGKLEEMILAAFPARPRVEHVSGGSL